MQHNYPLLELPLVELRAAILFNPKPVIDGKQKKEKEKKRQSAFMKLRTSHRWSVILSLGTECKLAIRGRTKILQLLGPPTVGRTFSIV